MIPDSIFVKIKAEEKRCSENVSPVYGLGFNSGAEFMYYLMEKDAQDLLISFQIFLENTGILDGYEWDWEKEAKLFLKQYQLEGSPTPITILEDDAVNFEGGKAVHGIDILET